MKFLVFIVLFSRFFFNFFSTQKFKNHETLVMIFFLFSFENATRNASGIFLPRLTRQEILAVECLKSKFQDPCQPFQQRKCIKKKNGDWKMISCQQASLRSLLNEEKKQCDCQEKRLQRKFLDK